MRMRRNYFDIPRCISGHTTGTTTVTIFALVVGSVLVLTGCATPDPSKVDTSVNSLTAETTAVADAFATLDQLPVKGRAPRTGYSREEFGQRWKDTDHNGCDQRNDVLARDLENAVAPAGCAVESGVLHDPYTGTVIQFQRGQDTSALVQIDHVVALADAWQKGAQQLTTEERELLANDPLNLLAVDGFTNQAKGAGDAATWLPPNEAYRCDYVARQVEVKHRYGLWVTQSEKDAIARVLDECSSAPEVAPKTVLPETIAPEAEPVLPAAEADVEGENEPYYANCAAARAAGVTPLYRGQPGYRPQMDGDGDGVACE